MRLLPRRELKNAICYVRKKLASHIDSCSREESSASVRLAQMNSLANAGPVRKKEIQSGLSRPPEFVRSAVSRSDAKLNMEDSLM